MSISTVVIAGATFLWYRKGKLWNFYDAILEDCLDQIKTNSMDRKAWEANVQKQCGYLSEQMFQSLFRFELEYLRQRVVDNKHTFWIPDSGQSVELSDDQESYVAIDTRYHDKEKYCKYAIRNIFYSEFNFCGFLLFFKALRHQYRNGKDQDTGYTERSVVVGRTDPTDQKSN